jgi:beta-N-acetylhexosaminidase
MSATGQRYAEAAGRVLAVGIPSPSLDAETSIALLRLAPGGIVLFGRNLDQPRDLADLEEALRNTLRSPFLLAIDQEGGRVSRLRPWIGPTASAAALAALGADAARAAGTATGRTLRALGFGLDFAPVVDLGDPGRDNVIGDRSFGTAPERVTELAGAFLDALQATGVAGCLKHFPGLGDGEIDPHESLPVCRCEPETLWARDLVPYRDLAPRAAAVMVGHGSFPDLDPAPGRPATLSPSIVGGWLRARLGFRGLVVTDDMDMGAIAPLDPDGSAAVAAIGAGCDLLLYCKDLERAARAREALVRAAEADAGFAARLEAAAETVRMTAALYPAGRADLAAFEAARAG